MPVERPFVSDDAPKIGGRIKVRVEDFSVDEIPAYEPCGEGQHIYLRVEKRDVDGRSLVDTIADHFGVDRGDIGTAGIKDRRAVTRQWVSVPDHKIASSATPEVGRLDEGIEIVRVARHRNKLRTGHLDGNRFSVTIRETSLAGDELVAAVEAVASAIEDRGMANYYGLQRFGRQNSTLEAGWKWLTTSRSPRRHFMQKMAASAIQSEIFNRVLRRRLEDGTWKTVVDGDIFEKTDTGGRFWIDESEREETQRRLDNRAIVVTGPMPGSEQGLADGEAGRRERRVVDELGLEPSDFEVFGRRGRGTRRPMTIYPENLRWEIEGDRRVDLEFRLPAGSYATVLLREFTGEDYAHSA